MLQDRLQILVLPTGLFDLVDLLVAETMDQDHQVDLVAVVLVLKDIGTGDAPYGNGGGGGGGGSDGGANGGGPGGVIIKLD